MALLALAITVSFVIGAFAAIATRSCNFDTGICTPYSLDYNFDPGTFWKLMIIGLVCAFIAGIPAIILGRRARREIRQSNGRLIGLRAAESGIVLAWLVPGDWVALLLWQLLKLLWRLMKVIGTLFHLIARPFFKD